MLRTISLPDSLLLLAMAIVSVGCDDDPVAPPPDETIQESFTVSIRAPTTEQSIWL